MNTFIISDTHFNHKNIIDYCDRPFASVEEMNDFIVEKWNQVVNNGDIVYHLGDLALGKQEDVRQILTKLKGRKTLVMGNHDHFSVQFYRECGFQVSRRPIELVFDSDDKFYRYLLSHFPQSEENNIYGHIHDKPNNMLGFCACVEKINYTPIRIEVIKEYLNEA